MKRSFSKFAARLDELGLLNQVEKMALKHRVTMKNLYGQGYAPSVVAARRAVYAWLRDQGKGNNEIARLFDRAQSGVSKLMKEEV